MLAGTEQSWDPRTRSAKLEERGAEEAERWGMQGGVGSRARKEKLASGSLVDILFSRKRKEKGDKMNLSQGRKTPDAGSWLASSCQCNWKWTASEADMVR